MVKERLLFQMEVITQVLLNIDFLIGNFKDGLKEGYGKIVYKDGTYYEGLF